MAMSELFSFTNSTALHTHPLSYLETIYFFMPLEQKMEVNIEQDGQILHQAKTYEGRPEDFSVTSGNVTENRSWL